MTATSSSSTTDASVSALSVLKLNPYRIFFPLGILFALLGVGEWVIWSLGWTVPAVALTHASLQSQGFLTCFVVGFLMTAFPRFSGTEPANVFEIGTGLILALGIFVATINKWFFPAQILYGALILTLMAFGGRRLPRRQKALPASFLLMGFGFLHALTGTALMITSEMGSASVAQFTIGRQMIQVGFLLCMVLGITGQLAPFLMGYAVEPGSDEDPASRLRTGARAMVLHGVSGALIYFSFWLIPSHDRWAFGLRAIVATGHLLVFARISRPVRKKTALIYFFVLSMWMIVVGLWTVFLFPVYRIAALHFVFIGGFSLMIFSFGQLVVLSHSGRAQLLNGRLIPLKIVGTAVVLAMLMRSCADVIPSHYMILIHAASGLWVLAAAFWLINLLPKMFGRSSVARVGAVILFAGLTSPFTTRVAHAQSPVIPDDTKQVVFVVSDGWSATKGILYRYERINGHWSKLWSRIPVSLGANGSAWGAGLHPNNLKGPQMSEEGNQTPAGVFRIGKSYGSGPRPETLWPYQVVDETWRCVDDPQSRHYNQILSSKDPRSVDWKTSENMMGYRWAITIEHNFPNVVAGAGSCLFLHLGEVNMPTGGCIGMEDADLIDLMEWLRPEAHPLLINLPKTVFQEIKANWGLQFVEKGLGRRLVDFIRR